MDILEFSLQDDRTLSSSPTDRQAMKQQVSSGRATGELQACMVILCLLAAACSSSPTSFTDRVFGVVGGCSPIPDEQRSLLYVPGGFVLEEGDELSDLTVEIESPTGFTGQVRVALNDDPAFTSGFGIDYDETLDLFSAQRSVDGPGTARIVLVVELPSRAETIIFSDAQFTLNGVQYQSSEGDAFELHIDEDGC